MVLLYVFLVATVNLCVGYVVGAACGWLPGPLRRQLSGLQLTTPAAMPLPTPTVERRQRKQPAATRRPSQEKEVAVAASSPDTPTPAETSGAENRSQQDRIELGLANFRNRLASLKVQIDSAEGDSDQLDQCAAEMQDEGQKYLDHSNNCIDELSGSDEDVAIEAAVVETNQQVEQATRRLQDVADADTAESKLEILRESSESLEESTADLSSQLDEVRGKAAHEDEQADDQTEDESPPADPTAALATIDELQSLIADHFANHGEDEPLPVASIRLDESADKTRPSIERFLSGIGELVTECLEEDQVAAIDEADQILVLLPGDGTIEATDRLEALRQKVAAAQFACDGEIYNATVSCGFTDSRSFHGPSELQVGLNDTMKEASRFGTNRTFHHDGRLAAPVVPAAIDAESVTIEI